MAGLDQRVLICGNLLSWGNHGVAFAQDVEPGLVWPGVTEALYRLRKADRMFGRTDLILIKDLPQDDDVAAQALHPYSYRPFATEPDMVLALDPACKKHVMAHHKRAIRAPQTCDRASRPM